MLNVKVNQSVLKKERVGFQVQVLCLCKQKPTILHNFLL